MFTFRELIGRKVGGGVLRAAFAKRRGWEEVRWQRWANGEVSEIEKRKAECDGGYVSVGQFWWSQGCDVWCWL